MVLTESQRIALDGLSSGMSPRRYEVLYEGLLLEGEIKLIVKNVIQAAVSAGLDIAAAGLPLDTLVDVMMAVAETSGVIDDIKADPDLLSVGDYSVASVIRRASLANGPDSIMTAVEASVATIVKSAKSAGIETGPLLEKLASQLQEVISASSEATADWIAALIPDVPGVDIAIAGALKQVSANSFDTLKKVYESLPEAVRGLFESPKELEAAMRKALDAIVKHLSDEEPVDPGESQGKERSLISRVVSLPLEKLSGAANALSSPGVMSVMGQKVADFLKNEVRPRIPHAVKMMQAIVPMTFALAACVQVIMREGASSAKNDKNESVVHLRAIREYVTVTANGGFCDESSRGPRRRSGRLTGRDQKGV